MHALAVLLAYAFQYFQEGLSFPRRTHQCRSLCVISSSIAIPSVKYLSSYNREFITYESSLSDIFGWSFSILLR